MGSLIALARDQDSKGNTKWVERFKESNAKNAKKFMTESAILRAKHA
ncbi:hypothetical protein K3495_g238 [Podosphaera aphanis]|nr:hypothetical protein K3495_g238 [Podosphaera aphanis]